MKHPVRDRILVLLCALCALLAAAASVALTLGYFSLNPLLDLLTRVNNGVGGSIKIKAALIVAALVLVVLAAKLLVAVF